ncbi:MAG TPA: DUF1707 and DUF4190 domain-containing protein [Streptosporangiaceae bacterium]|jgi:hypothetical protein
MTSGDYADMRASDEDRRRVQALLNEAFAEGRLSQHEWDERATSLASAATYGDLDRLTADLPRPGPSAQIAPAHPAWPVAQQSTNGSAVAALVCGIAQFAFFPLFIAAIILGNKARREIRVTGEQGDGLARAGLILGYVGLAMALFGILAAVLLIAVTTNTTPGP